MNKNFFATTPGIILVGAVIGVIAIALQKLGNPANMGICVACFERDTVGALGLHRAGIVQYLRPEIMGLVLGALIAAIASREFLYGAIMMRLTQRCRKRSSRLLPDTG